MSTGWNSLERYFEIKYCQLRQLAVVDVVDVFGAVCAQLAQLAYLTLSLTTNLTDFFDFPILLNFCLGSSSCPSNTIKKNNYIIIYFIKSLPKGSLIIRVLYNIIL